jgi:hypothetical protein
MNKHFLLRAGTIIILVTILLGLGINLFEVIYFHEKINPLMALLLIGYSLIGIGGIIPLIFLRHKIQENIQEKKILLLLFVLSIIIGAGVISQVCLLTILMQVKWL